jgi:hypothetical protein
MRMSHLKLMVACPLALGVLFVGASWLRSQGADAARPAGNDNGLAAVRADLTSLENTRGEIQKLYEEAKKQKDIIRTSCVHEKLVRVTHIIALAREQFSRYLMEKASGGTGTAATLGQRVAMFKERAEGMIQEASQCAGEAIKVTDKAKVVETVDPKTGKDDPTEPVGSVWVMPRPPEASPYF